MRIVIDLQGAQTSSRYRGIGRYSMALTRALLREASGHEVWLVLNGALEESASELRRAFDGLVPHQRIRVFEPPGRVAEIDVHARARARAAEVLREHFIAMLEPDVVLVTSLFEGYNDDAVGSVGRFVDGARTAVILYDLIPLLNAEAYLNLPALRQFYMRKIDSLRRAGLLLSISDYAREEALAALGMAPDAIVAISTAVDDSFAPAAPDPAELDAIRRRFGVTRAMLMCAPGGCDPRKNVLGLITAFSLLPTAIRNSHQLLIASRLSPVQQAELQAHAARCRLRDADLILTGYVSDADLIALYQAASLFVFPSLHEGFGLPLLEAMACGTPAIGSNSTSIPEVIGLEEAMFDPHAPQAIADKIEAVLSDPALHARLRAHGPIQAKKFSWENTARRALRALEVLAASPPPSPAPAGSDLLNILATVAGLGRDEATMVQLATCLAAAPDPAMQPRLYIDISHDRDDAGGFSDLPSTHEGAAAEAVVLSDAGGIWHYRYAPTRAPRADRLSGPDAHPHAGRVADLRAGDLLLSTVASPAALAAHKDGLFAHLYRIGVELHFLVGRTHAGVKVEVEPDDVLYHAHQMIETDLDWPALLARLSWPRSA